MKLIGHRHAANSWKSLLWRHNGLDGVSNHQPHDCLLNRSFRRRSKKTSKPRVTGLCAGNSPVTSEFPAQTASNAENISIWWRHHVISVQSKYRNISMNAANTSMTIKPFHTKAFVNLIIRSYTCPCWAWSRNNYCYVYIGNNSWGRHQMETFFRVTGQLCREFIGNRWIPCTTASDEKIWCLLLSEPTVAQTMEKPVIWEAIALIMTSL